MAVFAEEWTTCVLCRVARFERKHRRRPQAGRRLVVVGHVERPIRALGWAERAIVLSDATDHELWPGVVGVVGPLGGWTGDLAGGETIAPKRNGSTSVVATNNRSLPVDRRGQLTRQDDVWMFVLRLLRIWWPVPLVVVGSVVAQKGVLESRYDVAGHAAEHLSGASAPFGAVVFAAVILIATPSAAAAACRSRRPGGVAGGDRARPHRQRQSGGRSRRAGLGHTPTSVLVVDDAIESAHGLANISPWYAVYRGTRYRYRHSVSVRRGRCWRSRRWGRCTSCRTNCPNCPRRSVSARFERQRVVPLAPAGHPRHRPCRGVDDRRRLPAVVVDSDRRRGPPRACGDPSAGARAEPSAR